MKPTNEEQTRICNYCQNARPIVTGIVIPALARGLFVCGGCWSRQRNPNWFRSTSGVAVHLTAEQQMVLKTQGWVWAKTGNIVYQIRADQNKEGGKNG